MGIFDSFKKALGNKTEGESDKISTAVQDNADGDSTQVDATRRMSLKRYGWRRAVTQSSQAIPYGPSLRQLMAMAQSI